MIKGYKFTKKKNPMRAIFASALGCISVVSICIVIYLAYMNKGVVPMQYANAVFLSYLFCVAGIVLSIQSIIKKDIYKFFPVLGITLNSIGIIMSVFILYMGIK